MILLDTHAVIWLEAGHPRARRLAKTPAPFAISPATLLELRFLVEHGRIRLRRSASLRDLADDERWTVDAPPVLAWFEAAEALSFTRDPFDRLILAHARVRDWKLATADHALIEHIDARRVFEL